MKKRKQKLVFCAIEGGMVEEMSFCGLCELWDGRRCCFGIDLKATARALRKSRSFFGKRVRQRRLPQRGGKRLHRPTTYEKWPIGNQAGAEAVMEDAPEYGVPELTEQDIWVPDPKDDEYVLPELIQEEWDIEPDVPDWTGTGEGMPEPRIPEPPVPGNPEPETLPGPPAIPGMESPQDFIPGFPPDPFNDPMS